ncbi:MAG: aspartate 1-decarboxylase [Phycisphaeraceae bacterium]
MLRKLLRAKIHRATITQCDPDYVGSLTVDAELLRAAGMRPNEAVHVFDIDNAARFETYLIRGEPGSGIIGVNGAAAHLVEPGHRIIVVCFGLMIEAELDEHQARVIVCDADNTIAQRLDYPSTLDEPAVAH